MATTNFNFTTLTGTETAGWNSINSLITSIDTQLNASNRLIYMSGWSAVAGQTIKWDAVNSRWVPGTLDAAALANNSVTEAKIATDAVTSGKIAADAVGSSEIAAGAVTLAKISPTGSTAGQVLTSTGSGSDPSWQNASIGEANIANGAVTENKIATDAVVDLKIKDGAVVTSKIADNAVTNAKLADNAVNTSEITASAVTYPLIRTDARSSSVNNTAIAGKYYTSTGYLTVDSLSRQSTQNPLVIANSASSINLQIAWNLGNIGDTITIVRMGSGSVSIECMADGPSGELSIFQDSEVSADITQRYGIVTLICIGTVATPFPTEGGLGGNAWLITGDYTF